VKTSIKFLLFAISIFALVFSVSADPGLALAMAGPAAAAVPDRPDVLRLDPAGRTVLGNAIRRGRDRHRPARIERAAADRERRARCRPSDAAGPCAGPGDAPVVRRRPVRDR